MASIDKLSILGVRSFDNQVSETIAFHKPLTLIVGSNGSGKTTIIECLRYATTGKLPPGAASGGAFIHDAKLCNEKEVLAQVKLAFRDTGGVKMICTRNMQLTVKKTTRSQKELEGNLFYVRAGERASLSTRQADLNALVPHYLGVSEAVLSDVIFCHQEESLWPMSTPSKLKEYFDNLFEANKYTKAIDNIKSMEKKYKEDLKTLHVTADYLRANKDKGKKMEKQAQKLSAECDALRTQHEDYEDRIKQAARNAENSWQKEHDAGAIVGELTGKRIEESTKKESVESLRENLVEMSDSDEELQSMLEQYEERVKHYDDDLQHRKEHYQELHGEIERTRGQVSGKERECGSYEAQAQSYERQTLHREKLIRETARSHNIRGFDLDLDDEQVSAFMDRIANMAREQNRMLERARRETQEELQGKQQAINGINEQKSAINSRKESARQTINTNDRKINSLQADLNRIVIDEGGKTAMELSMQETKAKLESAKADAKKADWDQQAQAAEGELRKLDDQKEKLDAELIEGTRQAGESARLDYVQKELKARQRQLDTMKGAHSDKINSLIGHDWTPATVEDDFQRTVEQSAAQLIEAEKQRDGISRAKEKLDDQLNVCRRDLKAKQQALKKAADRIKNDCGFEPDEYVEEVRKMEEGRETLKTDTDSAARMKEYFESCIKLATGNQPGCRTCKRSLKPKEVDILVATMKEEIKKLESQLGNAPDELHEVEELLDAAKAVASDHQAWERLSTTDIPELDKQLVELNKKRDGLIGELEAKDAIVSERQDAKRDVDAVSRTVQSISKLHSEVKNFEAQIEELSAKQISAGMSRGLEQIQEDLNKVNIDSRSLKARLNNIRTDRERARSSVSNLELEVRDIQSKLSTAEYQLKEKKSLDAQVEELKSLNNQQREAIKSLDSELQDLVPRLAQAQAKYDDAARRGGDKDRQLQADASKLNNSVEKLKLANQEIESYLARGGPEQLKRGKREVDNLKNEVTRLEQEQVQTVREVKALEDQVRSVSETRRSIADNQRYRRDLRQLQRVRDEIAELAKHNAEEEKARHESEGLRWQRERNKLAAEQATVIGSLKSKDETLVSLLADYDTEYKDSARKYKEAHIKVETTKACVEDLGRFSGALDKAIMSYHSLKMEEINRIVDELWRRTYQGTDVDTIMIRSESEGGRSTKSYNYRVAMVKQDAEMDMRGRCSAGQKVLACIIIRLALAECFGINCGLITLDEPTTNLDHDNIRALAASLSEIIKVRRQQRNFQLVVITHDEEFLRYMGCSDFADVYYRVARNESQKSQIERNNIAEIL